jgi:hypothetical protein
MNAIFLRRLDPIPFSRLPGFSKGRHFVPDRWSSGSAAWAKSLLDGEIRAELQRIYAGARKELGLRYSQVQRRAVEGGGTVTTPYFDYSLEAEQSREDPSLALLRREIRLKGEPPAALEQIFPPGLELVVPLKEQPDFGSVVDFFDLLREKRGGEVSETEDSAEYCSGALVLTFQSRELRLRSASAGFLALVAALGQLDLS